MFAAKLPAISHNFATNFFSMIARILTKETKRFISIDAAAYKFLLEHKKFGPTAIEGIEFESLNRGAYIWSKGGTRLRLAYVIAKQFIPRPNQPKLTAVPINGDECDLRTENIKWAPQTERKGITSKASIDPCIFSWGDRFSVRILVNGAEMSARCDTKAEAQNVLSLLKKEYPWRYITDIRGSAIARPVYLSQSDGRVAAFSSAQGRS